MDNNDVVVINLDKPRELKLRHRTLKRFLARTGKSMEDLESSLQDYDTLISLTYEMLHAEDPDLTPEQCDELLDLAPLGDVIKKTSEAVFAAFQALGDPANPINPGTPAPEGNSTGLNS